MMTWVHRISFFFSAPHCQFSVMEAQLRILFLLFFVVNSVLTQEEPPSVSSGLELSALFDLRSSLGIRARYWPRKLNPCANWTGVDCANGRVAGINLSGLKRTRVGRRNPQFAVESLANFTFLVSFNASGFRLPGSIPDWFGQRLGALQVLDLRSSSIFGTIPQSIGSMNKLNSLILSGNSLTGIIPSSLGQLFSLSILDVADNTLTGSIPPTFSALQNLTNLDMSSNFISGPIPPGFGLLSSLEFLNLSNNSLSASVPAQLGNLSQLIELNLGFNSLSGLLPDELGGLRSLRTLLIESNDLRGSLPQNLFRNLPYLQQVDLSGNNFTGEFSGLITFLNATNVMLNISNNQFYGNLTSPVGNFGMIDLSSNYIQGLASNTAGRSVIIIRNCFIGVQDQRSLEDCRMFYAQRGLPFNGGSASPIQPQFPTARRRNNRLKYVLAGVFGGLGFIVLLVMVLVLLVKTCNKRSVSQRGTANVRPVPEDMSPPAQKGTVNLSSVADSFTYEQMLHATSGFNDTNLIKHGHSGDLFWGRLEGGLAVVIKRVDLRSSRKDSYLTELDFLSKATQTRLVPFLGHCLEHENDKLLVYKYMPNGDLSNSLYKVSGSEDDSLQSLDWITRLKIAIGAAEGLSYLHHECNPPLVHRDIQASSILLDDKYEVRLGSFSEVISAQGADNQQNVFTRLLRRSQTSGQGTSGSSPPSCSYDVYCFGKVLLELVTGKLGISKSDDSSTKEWLDQTLPFISIDDKELIAKIVDQSLVIDEDLLEEVWAVAIVAKSCLNPKPSKRPQMRHILRALENPFKVVREENFSSARLRTSSSRRSWSAALFGSWRQSSSERANIQSQMNKEGTSGSKVSGREHSQGSGANDRRLSNEIFPEPTENEDLERQDEEHR